MVLTKLSRSLFGLTLSVFFYLMYFSVLNSSSMYPNKSRDDHCIHVCGVPVGIIVKIERTEKITSLNVECKKFAFKNVSASSSLGLDIHNGVPCACPVFGLFLMCMKKGQEGSK